MLSTVLKSNHELSDPFTPLRRAMESLNRGSTTVLSHVDRFDLRFGPVRTALLIGLLVMAAACIYVRPALECVVQGCRYVELANDPFPDSGANSVAFRVLTPLISYLLGLRGNGIIITNLLFAYLMLAFLYWALRRDEFTPEHAALCTVMFGLSAPTLLTIYYGGYTDSLTYLLLAISFVFRRRPLAFWTAFGLNLFNREVAAFLLPWLAFLRWQERTSSRAFWIEVVAATSITLGVYGLFREWTASRMDVEFTFAHYVAPVLRNPLYYWKKSFGFQWIGFFTVFKLLWILPTFAIMHAAQNRDRCLIISALLLMGCVYAQFFFAWDSTRLFALGFPIMLLAWQALIPKNVMNVRQWLVALIVANFLVPNVATAGHLHDIMHGPIFAIARFLSHLHDVP